MYRPFRNRLGKRTVGGEADWRRQTVQASQRNYSTESRWHLNRGHRDVSLRQEGDRRMILRKG